MGRIVDTRDNTIGNYSSSGVVSDSSGRTLGHVDWRGVVYTAKKHDWSIGKVNLDGSVVTSWDKPVDRISGTTVYDKSDSAIGRVTDDTHNPDPATGVTDAQRAGAGLLMLLREYDVGTSY
ncbi:hypothetical protein [Streptomyces cahuitamycinicus]|uniref:hypothetical protein n=1 Tax=Streptomyces cahuitamycinicus TaxID=2070367 RepID=UPI0011AF88E0|nr:hypothetical protein [Streptomyces cahuitamycinicus]